MGESVVLSYGDCLLRSRDVELLQPPNWLNDALIGFAFEYLFNQLTDDLRDAVAMISPEVTQFIKLAAPGADDAASGADDNESLPLEIFLSPLGLQEKRFVFLAINNNNDSDAAGGSHWSLLAYARPSDSFVHFDSASSNHCDACRVAEKLHPFLHSPNSSSFSSSSSSSSSRRVVESPSAAKQTNGFDCGMFVIFHLERIVDALKAGEDDVFFVDASKSKLLVDALRRKSMTERRKEWTDRIYRLAGKT